MLANHLLDHRVGLRKLQLGAPRNSSDLAQVIPSPKGCVKANSVVYFVKIGLTK